MFPGGDRSPECPRAILGARSRELASIRLRRSRGLVPEFVDSAAFGEGQADARCWRLFGSEQSSPRPRFSRRGRAPTPSRYVARRYALTRAGWIAHVGLPIAALLSAAASLTSRLPTCRPRRSRVASPCGLRAGAIAGLFSRLAALAGTVLTRRDAPGDTAASKE